MTTAVVVGAGIAGLAAAVGLHRAGWSVQVLEQRPELPTAGTAVVLHRSALEGLASLGLGTGLATRAIPLTELQLRTRTGVPITPSRPGSGSALIDRSALVDLLRASLPEPVVALGRSLAVRDLPDLRAQADLVVAADGVHSSLRQELFGCAYRATATGTTVWRGTADMVTTGLTEYWGQRRRFGISGHPGGGTNWYATALLPPTPAGSAQPGPDELRRLFGHWSAPVAATLAKIDEGTVLRHGIYHLARRLPLYHRGNVALVGDAAHAMTPDLGRGANEAILDALSLTRSLEAGHGVDLALAAYDKSRRRPTQVAATGSAVLDTLIHRGLWRPSA
ncbi:FAD-dependent oxidoreductase [Arthrobacter sp. NPDC092385]|uniref:FAD-dependent oxidoreductase n=1 Tax=Arthrobacter sp. NPDC092385 TaxID=3363943 RepID=UPI00380FEC3A